MSRLCKPICKYRNHSLPDMKNPKHQKQRKHPFQSIPYFVEYLTHEGELKMLEVNLLHLVTEDYLS